MTLLTVVYDLGTITDWLTAIGTISAVVVALYLSKKDRNPKAKVKATYSYEAGVSSISTHPVRINLEIVNLGFFPITLKECTLSYKRKNKMIFREGYSKVDMLLRPGEHYEHSIPFEPIAKLMISDNVKQMKTYFYFQDASGKKYKTKVRLFI